MTLNTNQKTEILRLYLNGSNLYSISRHLKIETDEVLDALLENPTTKESVMDDYNKHKEGKFVSFFYQSKLGREPLPENKKRKIKQIRLSDEEMEALGNPSSTYMRTMMFQYKQLEKFCQFLDKKGITLILDECLGSKFDKNDPFWKQGVYSDNFSKLKTLLNDEELWGNFQVTAPE